MTEGSSTINAPLGDASASQKRGMRTAGQIICGASVIWRGLSEVPPFSQTCLYTLQISLGPPSHSLNPRIAFRCILSQLFGMGPRDWQWGSICSTSSLGEQHSGQDSGFRLQCLVRTAVSNEPALARKSRSPPLVLW